MNERLIHLKIKIKCFAAEAMIIRQEAHKTKGMIKWNLNDHRTTVVREHTRYNLLAYGLLKGIPYSVMEKKSNALPPFDKIIENAMRFGGDEKTVQTWITEAKIYRGLK